MPDNHRKRCLSGSNDISMASTVHEYGPEVQAPLPKIFRSMFPCRSVDKSHDSEGGEVTHRGMMPPQCGVGIMRKVEPVT
jgi:hypothetical protein